MAAARIEHIDTPEGRALWREMLDILPGLQAVLNFVTNRQPSSVSGKLFWYQTELFERWFFRIPSPHTARMIHSADSWTGRHQTTFFRFPDAPEMILASYGGSDRFPMGALLLTSPSGSPASGVAFSTRNLSGLTEDVPEMFQAFAPADRHRIPVLSSATALVDASPSEDPMTLGLMKEASTLKSWRQPVALAIREESFDPSPIQPDRPATIEGSQPPANQAGHVSFYL
ncbi:MAG: hypothetical protein ABF876_05955 [Acetobacter aceti]|uniref:Uncharacterized protein n=1 Tax=Acetobacter aceti TaxID=435 RepID=A0A1U9KFD6_ACEAC|nr:hypothetical protein [Acetobacter aceti]AQS84523.1 hypothetical protein A0U92_06725 [Acetobacter aceti]